MANASWFALPDPQISPAIGSLWGGLATTLAGRGSAKALACLSGNFLEPGSQNTAADTIQRFELSAVPLAVWRALPRGPGCFRMGLAQCFGKKARQAAGPC